MKASDLVKLRLHNQLLTQHPYDHPAEVVRHLGAVQAQDFAGALWGLGLRRLETSEASVAENFNRGTFVRLHVMRPTWHFVPPEDIQWMLNLSADRIRRSMDYVSRQAALDAAIFAKAEKVLAKALKGRFLPKQALKNVLAASGINQAEQQFTFIMIHAETCGLVCSGPRQGKQFTYALVEDRAPFQRSLSREEALAELAHRYITSHGPASERDFAWWSGLTLTDTRKALSLVDGEFATVYLEDTRYWLPETTSAKAHRSTMLLPNYDEFTVAYADRSHFFDERHRSRLDSRGQAIFQNVILSEGVITGTWRRTLAKTNVTVELTPFETARPKQRAVLQKAAEQYANFVGLELALRFA